MTHLLSTGRFRQPVEIMEPTAVAISVNRGLDLLGDSVFDQPGVIAPVSERVAGEYQETKDRPSGCSLNFGHFGNFLRIHFPNVMKGRESQVGFFLSVHFFSFASVLTFCL